MFCEPATVVTVSAIFVCLLNECSKASFPLPISSPCEAPLIGEAAEEVVLVMPAEEPEGLRADVPVALQVRGPALRSDDLARLPIQSLDLEVVLDRARRAKQLELGVRRACIRVAAGEDQPELALGHGADFPRFLPP